MQKLLVILAILLLAPVGLACEPVDFVTVGSLHGGLTRSEGFSGATWTTDLVVTNTGASASTVSLEILPTGPLVSLPIAPGSVAIVRDVIRAMGLRNGSYAARLSVLDPCGETHAYLSTSTPSAIGGRVAVQLPPLNERTTAVLPLVSSGNARVAVYVAAEEDASWRVTFSGIAGDDERLLHVGLGGGLVRLVSPAWAIAATFEKLPWQGPGGWTPEHERAAAYVTFADNATNAPEVVQ